MSEFWNFIFSKNLTNALQLNLIASLFQNFLKIEDNFWGLSHFAVNRKFHFYWVAFSIEQVSKTVRKMSSIEQSSFTMNNIYVFSDFALDCFMLKFKTQILLDLVSESFWRKVKTGRFTLLLSLFDFLATMFSTDSEAAPLVVFWWTATSFRISLLFFLDKKWN